VVCPEDYAWSSYRQYIRARRRWKWLETAWTLEQFGGAGREGQARYRRFVEEGLRCELADPSREAVSGVILGGERFVGWVCEGFLSWCQDAPAVSQKIYFLRVDPHSPPALRQERQLSISQTHTRMTQGSQGGVHRRPENLVSQERNFFPIFLSLWPKGGG